MKNLHLFVKLSYQNIPWSCQKCSPQLFVLLCKAGKTTFQHLTPPSETFGRFLPTFYFQIKIGISIFLLFNENVIKIKCTVNARCSRIYGNKIANSLAIVLWFSHQLQPGQSPGGLCHESEFRTASGKPQCFLVIFKHHEMCFASSLLSFPKLFSRYRGSLLLLAEQYRNGYILRRKQRLVPCDALRRTWAMENMQETYWEGSGLLWGSLLARLSILSKGLLH